MGPNVVKAVDGVSFTLDKGDPDLSKSGCGKSTVGRLILDLYGPPKEIFPGRTFPAWTEEIRR